MRLDTAARLLFVLYCVQAGMFLIMAPWSINWDRMLLHMPNDWLRLAGLHPLARGAVTGFGVVHVIWGAHDLAAWLELKFGPPRDRP